VEICLLLYAEGKRWRPNRLGDQPTECVMSAMPWCKVTLRGENSVPERESILREFEIVAVVKGNLKSWSIHKVRDE
jgi:hypothetical protein